MPWWLFLYLAVIAIVVALAVRDDLQEQTEIPYIVAEVVANGLLALVALGYWLPTITSFLGASAPIFYSVAVAWLVVGTVRELRSISPSPTLAVVAGSVAFYAALYGPRIYWGFASSFGRVQNGA